MIFYHPTPTGYWRLGAYSQKTQPTFNQYRTGKIGRRNNDQRGDKQRENMIPNDSGFTITQCLGSFDKGLFLSVPYNLLLPRNTRGKYSTVVRSIERDGGRRLEGGVGNLWWDRRATRFDALQNNRERIAP